MSEESRDKKRADFYSNLCGWLVAAIVVLLLSGVVLLQDIFDGARRGGESVLKKGIQLGILQARQARTATSHANEVRGAYYGMTHAERVQFWTLDGSPPDNSSPVRFEALDIAARNRLWLQLGESTRQRIAGEVDQQVTELVKAGDPS